MPRALSAVIRRRVIASGARITAVPVKAGALRSIRDFDCLPVATPDLIGRNDQRAAYGWTTIRILVRVQVQARTPRS